VTPSLQRRDYSVGDRVWVYQPDYKNKSSKFAEDWVPNWVIRKVLSSKRVILERNGGASNRDVRTVHIAHVKPFIERDQGRAEPAAHGQKRKAHADTVAPSAKKKKVAYTHMDKVVDELVDDSGVALYRTRWSGLAAEHDTYEPESAFMIPGGAKNPILLRWFKRKAQQLGK